MPRAVRRPLEQLGAGLALGALLVLGACGTSSPAPASSASSGPAASTAPAAPGPSAPTDAAAAFCQEVRANGANGASFGPLNLGSRRPRFLKDVQAMLDAMGDVKPPAEIAEPWAVQKQTLLRAKAAARPLSDDQGLVDIPDVNLRDFHGGKIDKAQDTLTDYYFAHCQ